MSVLTRMKAFVLMGLRARGGRLRAGAAVGAVVSLLLPAPSNAYAAGAPPVPPQPAVPSPETVPPLPSVPLDITDGQPIQTLYSIALSLSSNVALTAKLRSQIAATQRQLDDDSVTASQAAGAETAATDRASAASERADTAGRAYRDLDGALKHAVVFMYTSGPMYVRMNPNAGDDLAYAADYAGTALSPGGILSTRRYDASLRKTELAIATASQLQAQEAAQKAAAAVAAEKAAEASLESQLASVVTSSTPQLVAETTALASQAGQELLSTTGLEFTPPTPLPGPLGTTSVALSWAFSELGKSYVWGATGPDTFDCSGLTQYAWEQAGVGIPRVAADQDSWTIPVPLSELLPGDLVFFGKSDIHHVGIYIGGGLMINAPHTGDVVRVSSIWWSDLAGFGRVHDANTPIPVHQAPTSAKPSPPAVVPVAGPVPSQTQPPPGWQPQPGSTTPISVDSGGAATTTTTTTAPPNGPSSSGSTTTTSPSTTAVSANSGPTTSTTVTSGG